MSVWDSATEEVSNSTQEELLLKITDCLEDTFTAKSGKVFDVLKFKLKGVDKGVMFEAMQFLNKDEKTGKFKNIYWPPYEDTYGDKKPGSLVYEILEAIKAKLGEAKYEERKTKVGGALKPEFFKGAQFKFVVKITKDEDCFLMTESQKQRDAAYAAERKANMANIPEVKRAEPDDSVDNTKDVQAVLGEDTIDPNDLPF